MSLSTFPITEAQLVSGYLGTLLYGFHTIAFCFGLRYLLRNKTKNKELKDEVSWFMVAAGVSLWIFASMHIVLSIYDTIQAFVLYEGPGGLAVAITARAWRGNLRSAIFLLEATIGDIVLVYRCFIAYSRSWRAILFSILLLLAEIGCGLTIVVSQITTPPRFVGKTLTLVTWAIICASTMLNTLLIAIRTWTVEKSARINFTPGDCRSSSLTHIVMECGFLYAATMLIMLIVYSTGSNGVYPLTDAISQIIGIAFNSIIICAPTHSEEVDITQVSSGEPKFAVPMRRHRKSQLATKDSFHPPASRIWLRCEIIMGFSCMRLALVCVLALLLSPAVPWAYTTILQPNSSTGVQPGQLTNLFTSRDSHTGVRASVSPAASRGCTTILQANSSTGGVQPGQLNNLVTFGDSYTDVTAFVSRNITSWPVYAASYSNSSLYPFAKAGAVCSQALTPIPFPGVNVVDTQLPDYLNASASLNLNMSETLFTLWIGTNDLGQLGLLVGKNAPGVSIIDTTACAVDWVKTLYDNGARNFLFQQVIPLNLVPIYSVGSYPNKYWTAPRNTTEWSLVMEEFACTTPALATYMLRDLVRLIPEAHVGVFDTYNLFADMYNNPQDYFNGSAPLNVKTPIESCVFAINESTSDTGNCTVASERDSYMWWDELHPSEQSGRNLAAQIAEVISTGTNKWATWLS